MCADNAPTYRNASSQNVSIYIHNLYIYINTPLRIKYTTHTLTQTLLLNYLERDSGQGRCARSIIEFNIQIDKCNKMHSHRALRWLGGGCGEWRGSRTHRCTECYSHRVSGSRMASGTAPRDVVRVLCCMRNDYLCWYYYTGERLNLYANAQHWRADTPPH